MQIVTSHAARQLPSWLIFDVRQNMASHGPKKTIVIVRDWMGRPVAAPSSSGRESASPRSDCRLEFRAVAAAYRKRSKAAAWTGVIAIIQLPLVFVPHYGPLALLLTLAGLLVALCVKVTLPTLICPACENQLDRELGDFCPGCGASNLFRVRDEWRAGFTPQCFACLKTPARGRGGRAYTIRFCTHCGAHVDSDGV